MTALTDEFPSLHHFRRKVIFLAWLCFAFFLLGLLLVTEVRGPAVAPGQGGWGAYFSFWFSDRGGGVQGSCDRCSGMAAVPRIQSLEVPASRRRRRFAAWPYGLSFEGSASWSAGQKVH